MSRCDSAAIVPKTSELLPEPETPVKTVSRRFGISTLTSLRLLTRAPCTRITSWLSPVCRTSAGVPVLVAKLMPHPSCGSVMRASRFLIGLVTCFATHDGIPAAARTAWRR